MEDKGSQPPTKKKTRRSQAKYPALERKFNLKMRQDYIEPDYLMNPVKNSKGEVIESLRVGDEEREFMNKFYEEVIGANFLYDKELKDLHTAMKPLKKKKRLRKEEKEELQKLQALYYKRADEVLIYSDQDDQRQLYKENNQRNNCLFNRSKGAGRLHEINDDTFNDIHDNVYYCVDSGENLLINQIENKLKVKIRKKDETK